VEAKTILVFLPNNGTESGDDEMIKWGCTKSRLYLCF